MSVANNDNGRKAVRGQRHFVHNNDAPVSATACQNTGGSTSMMKHGTTVQAIPQPTHAPSARPERHTETLTAMRRTPEIMKAKISMIASFHANGGGSRPLHSTIEQPRLPAQLDWAVRDLVQTKRVNPSTD